MTRTSNTLTIGLIASLLGLLLPANAFTMQPQPATSSSTQLHAVSLPLFDTHASSAGDAFKSRQSRIDTILEHARHAQRKREQRLVDTAVHGQQPQQDSAAIAANTAATAAPLPFTLPTLSAAQQSALTDRGEIVMQQEEMGRQGSGFVVQDIQGDQATVWQALLEFDRYADRIHTVRSATIQGRQPARFGTPSTTRATFSVSKFHLSISCILQYRPQQNYLELSLDNGLQNSALQHAKGYWYTEAISPTTTRVWLLCDLTLSPWLPSFIVDTAAASAMPRASTWLWPAVQALQAQAQQVASV